MRIICIDYDNTFSADPILFTNFIKLAKGREWKVIGCTMRHKHEIDKEFEYFMSLIDACYFTARTAKKPFLTVLGIEPDIWIDDRPDWIFVNSK